MSFLFGEGFVPQMRFFFGRQSSVVVGAPAAGGTQLLCGSRHLWQRMYPRSLPLATKDRRKKNRIHAWTTHEGGATHKQTANVYHRRNNGHSTTS